MRKTSSIYLLGLLVVLLLYAGVTSAAWWDKDKAKGGKAKHPNRRAPSEFVLGRVQEDAKGGWVVNGLKLRLPSTAQVLDAKGRRLPDLVEGAEVMLTGYRLGDCFILRQGRIMPAESFLNPMPGKTPGVEWSEANPAVGEGTGQNPL